MWGAAAVNGYTQLNMLGIKSGLGGVIPADDLSSVLKGQQQQQEINVEDFALVASYNWTAETKFPTIIVPGAPNVWTPTRLPMRVPQDAGKIFVDQNKARFPVSPLEPLIRAVDLVRPDFDLTTLDIVTDRNNLRKLYRWVTRSADLENFRIDAELAGNSVLFTRWENKSEEFISEFRGFGHEFEKANTGHAPGCEKSTGHHRIVTYNFGDLKLLVRYEVDACFSLKEDETIKIGERKQSETAVASSGKSDDPDDLVAALGAMTITKEPKPFDENSKLHYIRNGIFVKQSEILELKTRVQHKALDWNDTWPQLYFSQTPTLLLAKHLKGQFVTIENNQLSSSSVQPYIRAGKSSLVALKKALSVMKSLVETNDKGDGVAFVYENGTMKMYFRDGGTLNTKVNPSLVKLFEPSK